MKVGFFTACFPSLSIEEIAEFAAQEGFQTLEIAAWPRDADRKEYAPAHLDIDALAQGNGVSELKGRMEDLGLEISSLGYYPNNLHSDAALRGRYHAHLKKVIDAAQRLGVKLVGTFVGRDTYSPLEKEIERAKEIFPPLIKYAEDHGVKIMIENCAATHLVIPEGFPLGMNLFYSPKVWRILFEEIPSESFGLNFDPSHLYWLGVDHLRAIREFGDRIFHFHAKDTELLPEELYENGFLGTGWFRYRAPGYGAIDWRETIKALYDINYDYVLSIEHEDPIWEGSVEKVKQGLILGKRELVRHII
jgi:sugar phosphate isomerase/epimerase